jgi:hypothetical protein
MDEFEQLRAWEARAQQAQAKAAQAYLRLIELAEQHDTGQAARVARFLASTFNGALYPLDLFELRALDVALPDGEARVAAMLQAWGIDKRGADERGGSEP